MILELDEAIKRFINNAEYERIHGDLQGCIEFRQLADWLKELKAVREAWSQLVETVVEIKDNAVDDKDSDSNAKNMARFFFNYLKILEDGIMKEKENADSD